MPEHEAEAITYQVGNITFLVTPVYNTSSGESISAILLKLIEADLRRV